MRERTSKQVARSPAATYSSAETGTPNGEEGSDASVEASVDEVIRAIAHAPPRPPPLDPAPGTKWGERGRYVIEQRLGRGGMGTVYLASDTLLARRVALKVLDTGDEIDGRPMPHMREARLAAGLEHERVARVYDVGEHEGSAFVAMEYVRGQTLRAWMAEPRAPQAIERVVVQIAEGLGVLHAAGVVHRDLKPENVMLATPGGVKLLDFGLAGHVETLPAVDARRDVARAEGSRSTAAFLGTPGYMAPEQYAGERADARADVFALGIVIYELVTGARPFRGATMMALLREVRETPPSFEEAAWADFPRLKPATARMLRVARDERFANGDEVVKALRAPEAPTIATSEAASTPWWQTRLSIAVAAFGALVGTTAFVAPRVSRWQSLRAALAKPPPAGMALVNEGALTVGQSAETVARQCADLGTLCNPELMEDQIPSLTVTVAPYYLDTREVTNREMVAMLSNLASSLFVAPDEDDHSLRYVRFNAAIGKPAEFLLDLRPKFGGIEYEPGRGFRARAGRESWPVNQVTWFGAKLYCATQGKRLPTENEWEAAARGNTNRPFPWGGDAPRCGEVVVPSDGFLAMAPSCPKTTSPVDVATARQDVDPEGVHDLGGNVTEWVNTAFIQGDRSRTGPEDDPSLPRVLRGGSFYFSLLARTSVRNRRPADYVGIDVGFRCAADLPIDFASPRKDH